MNFIVGVVWGLFVVFLAGISFASVVEAFTGSSSRAFSGFIAGSFGAAAWLIYRRWRHLYEGGAK